MRHNYFVSVFVDGKNIYSFFAKDLDALVTIKALYKNCEIDIFDVDDFVRFTPEQIRREVINSGERWKKSLNRPSVVETIPKQPGESKKEKTEKHWARSVLCVDTGQVFSSIRECSNKTGIPYMTIVNSVKNNKTIRGFRFVNYIP